MGDKSVELLRQEAEQLIKSDIEVSGAVTYETWNLASEVYSEKEIKNLVLKHGGNPLVRPEPPMSLSDLLAQNEAQEEGGYDTRTPEEKRRDFWRNKYKQGGYRRW